MTARRTIRSTRGARFGLTWTLAAVLLGGCVLGGSGIEPRYYSAADALDAALPAAVAGTADALPVELEPVSAVGHLRERMVWRDGRGEVGYREAQRWSELPADLVARGLEAAVFAEPRLTLAGGRSALRLTVVLEEFGELRGEPLQAELRLRARLVRRDGSLVFQRRFGAQLAVDAGDPRQLASALGELLATELDAVCAAVVEAASAEAAAESAAAPGSD